MSNTILPFVVAGITTGAVYGLAGSGLVITYKTSGVFNFAHGAIAAAAAYLFYWLTVVHGQPWVLAFIVSVPIFGTVAGLVLEWSTRRLGDRAIALQIVGMIGIILLIQALSTIKFGPDPLTQPQYLPHGAEIVRILGVNVSWAQTTVTTAALVLTLGFYLLLRMTRVGLSMRAVVDDASLLGLHGTSPRRTRSTAWIVGSSLAAASGVLLAPFVQIQAISLTYLVIAATGAAAVGGFSSIPMTYVGGIAIGVISTLIQKYSINVESLAGLPVSVPYIVLLVAILALPARRLRLRSGAERSINPTKAAPLRIALPAAAAAFVVLVAVPAFAGVHIMYYTQGLATGIMLLSLGLLVRLAGQVSLAQSVFGAIGAVTFSQVAANFGVPWVLAVLIAAVVVVPVAALVALISMRLSGLFLALGTLAFAIIVERFAYPLSFMFGGTDVGRLISRPSFASSDNDFYYVVLAFFGLALVGVLLIARGRLGRMLQGLSEAPTVLRTLGLSVNLAKLIIFCIAASLAAISGILYGGTVTYATYADPAFSSFQSLVLLAVLVILPLSMPWSAFFAVPIAIVPAYFDGGNVSNWLNALFGLSAIFVSLGGQKPKLPTWVEAMYGRLEGRPRVESCRLAGELSLGVDLGDGDAGAQLRPGLRATGLTVRFGGLVALNGLTFEAPLGRVTGLIGPNGAGKTTTFNACSGTVRATSGSVSWRGSDVTSASAAVRGRLGLGRTFQVTALCENLTVSENVALGREAGLAGAGVVSQIVGGRAQRREVERATNEALSATGISHLAGVQAANLTTGERRLVEVARCLAGNFAMLLLDEPSAGLDKLESERLRLVLRSMVAQRGCGILLVEHDMEFVLGLCDYIYVLDFGELLFEGSPDDVAASDSVQNAYLGSAIEGTLQAMEYVPDLASQADSA